MNPLKLIVFLFAIFATVSPQSGLKAQNEYKVLHKWKAYKEAPHALYNHLSSEAFD